jgi:hypothetical protein
MRRSAVLSLPCQLVFPAFIQLCFFFQPHLANLHSAKAGALYYKSFTIVIYYRMASAIKQL